MPRYIIIAIYPLLLIASGVAIYQTSKLSRDFPTPAWIFKRRMLAVFMLFQIYGIVRTWTVVRTFTWIDPIYLLGVLVLCAGLIQFDRLLLRDARSLRLRAAKILATPAVPVSGEMPPDFWSKEFRQAIRDTIKDEYLKTEDAQ